MAQDNSNLANTPLVRVVPAPRSKHQDEVLYREIFDAVLSQRLLPGTKLTEEQLTEIFKVSRAVVRRALLRLSHDQIVELRPNRGAYVSSPSVKQAREVLAARRLIETQIARAAATSMSQAQSAELRTLVERERDCFSAGKRGSGIRLSGDFHLKLAIATGNATLTKFIKELVPLTSLAIARYETPGRETCSYDEHFHLLDVIDSGEAESAAAHMDEHLRRLEVRLDLIEDEARSDLQQVFAHMASPTTGREA